MSEHTNIRPQEPLWKHEQLMKMLVGAKSLESSDGMMDELLTFEK